MTDILGQAIKGRIEDLEAENKRLREALEHYACTCRLDQQCSPNETDLMDCGYKARAALEDKG